MKHMKTKIYNLNFLFNQDLTQVLMIHKNRGPFPNTLNGVGGKFDDNLDMKSSNMMENIIYSALREIYEETNVAVKENKLYHLVTERFLTGMIPPWDSENITELYVFAGVIDTKDVIQKEDEVLEWIPVNEIISSPTDDPRFSGCGNVPYFINIAIKYLSSLKEE